MLYDIGFLIFSVIYLPTLIFKGKLHREFFERFGRYAPAKKRALLSGRDRIWIQAVSVGEVAVCRSLIPLLKNNFPGRELVISTITKSGNDLAKKLFSKDAAIIYFPLDFGFTVRRAVRHIRPGIYVMIETEIWPNLLKELSLNSIPSIMINGRISDRSIGKYRLVRPFLRDAFSKIRAFCMQDAVDAERVIELGASPDRVEITGNMKFDVEIPSGAGAPDAVRRSLRIDENDSLFVAGSTHKGEEETIVEAFKELLPEFPGLKLLIAPRHIERVEEVEGVITKSGLQSVRVSRLNESRLRPGGSDERRIMILDTIGHLNEAYSAATLVFVGGSLVKHGGQNPIEPAILGRAMLFGPHMFNFRHITKVLLREGAAVQIAGKGDLAENLKTLINDPLKRASLGDNAKRAIAGNRGATKKNLDKISEILRHHPARSIRAGHSEQGRTMTDFVYSLMTDKRNGVIFLPFKFILYTASLLYGLAILLRRILYGLRIFNARKAPLKIISVGNITLGGTGKTPFTMSLAKTLEKELKKNVSVLIRGYGWDEQEMLKRNLADVPVLVGPDRFRSSNRAVKLYGSDTAILDDGFQHWELARDLDIVLVDSRNPFGNGHLFPRGVLRESKRSLKRADVVVLTKNSGSVAGAGLVKKEVKAINNSAIILEAAHAPKHFYEGRIRRIHDLSAVRAKRVVLLSSIGDPLYFEETVKALGADVIEHIKFPDHYDYKKRDMERAARRCDEKHFDFLITTEKDIVKLNRLGLFIGQHKVLTLVVEMRILSGKEELIDRLRGLYTH